MLVIPRKLLWEESGKVFNRCNFIVLNPKFRASLEAICEIIIYTIRSLNNNFPNMESNNIATSLRMIQLKSMYGLFFNQDIEINTLSNLFKNTPYSTVIDIAVENLYKNYDCAYNSSQVKCVKFVISENSCLTSNENSQVPVRYRVGVSFLPEGESIDYYSEYWEDLGWVVMDSNSLNSSTVRLIEDIYSSGFFTPIVDLNSLSYNNSTGKFELSDIYHTMNYLTIILKVLDSNTGTVFTFLDNSSEMEPTSVLTPFRSVNISNIYENHCISEMLPVIKDVNGIDTYLMLRSVRSSQSFLGKILTFLYTEDYYEDIIQLTVPNKFSIATWKFSDSNFKPADIYKHTVGANIVVEFQSILDIPSDRLSKLGVSVPQVVEETRKSYDWFCSSNWQLKWNQILQKSTSVLENIEIPFNFEMYKVSLHLTQIECMFYFISCVQRYLLFVYMKLLSKTEKHNNKCIISLCLGFNYMIESAINHFESIQNDSDSERFFRDRSVDINRNNVTISSLTGNALVMKTNDIYLKWVDISKGRLRGSKVFYPQVKVDLANGLSREFSSIVDFIFSDLIKIFGYTTKSFMSTSFPHIIEEIDFKILYSVVTDTTSLNHKRLCIELCKYYCEFYGNEFIIEDYT